MGSHFLKLVLDTRCLINENELNRSGRGELINVDDISAAFGVAGTASGAETPENVLQAIKYMRDGVLGANDAQGIAPIDITSKEKDSCTTCNKVGTKTQMKNDNYHTKLVPAKK